MVVFFLRRREFEGRAAASDTGNLIISQGVFFLLQSRQVLGRSKNLWSVDGDGVAIVTSIPQASVGGKV